jgi:hypothetical protein
MPIQLRRVYLDTIRDRYINAPKKQKTLILDEFCLNCEYSRKYAIRILNGEVTPRMKKPGPKPIYDNTFVFHLHELWIAMNRICSKNMKAALPLWLPFYGKADERVSKLLLQVSPASMDRLLKPFKTGKVRGLSTTRPSLIKNKIPIQLLDSEITQPGFIEADTVAHCGTSIHGQYSHSLTMTDLMSGWTENRAVWSKEAEYIVNLVRDIETELPFNLHGFACDNGTEFLNHELHDYLVKRDTPITFVRRRPYKKNDAAHVEQKNFTHVRELFGYERLENPQFVRIMNEIYRTFWNPLLNFFTPNLKLIKKERIGSKIKKTYDKPKTPYQRLMDSNHLSPKQRADLKDKIKTKNPFYLKEQLESRLKIFCQLLEEERRIQKHRTGTA